VKRRISLILVSVIVAVWCGTAFAGPDMTKGKWEITSKVEMEGLPMPMRSVKTTICMDPKEKVPQNTSKDQECKMISKKIEGNTVTWVMKCTGKYGTTTNKGKIIYKGDSFAGKMVMEMPDREGTRTMTQVMSGRRIGDCQ
jgi:hypothetical protein